MKHPTVVAMLLGAIPSGFAVAQSTRVTPTTADVPVTKVVLFSSGVGYFEHAGTVHGNGATRAALQDEPDQRHPQVARAAGSGRRASRRDHLSVAGSDSRRRCGAFRSTSRRTRPSRDLLNQLRGAKVTIQCAGGATDRHDPRRREAQKPAEKGEAFEVSVLNLLTGATIRSVELRAISNLTLDDPQLQEELTQGAWRRWCRRAIRTRSR